jgi:hypothetical protein
MDGGDGFFGMQSCPPRIAPQISFVAFDDAHEITDRVDLIGDYVCHLQARHLILNRDYYFEPIEPVGSQVVSEPRLVCHPRRINAEMSGDDLADSVVGDVLHGRSSYLGIEKTNQRIQCPENVCGMQLKTTV